MSNHPHQATIRHVGADAIPHLHRHQHQIQREQGPPEKWHSFKLLVDPVIHGASKLVRFDGTIVPGDPHHISPTPSDPRAKLPNALWKRLEPMELQVPKFKVDENYVGDPPKVEVTIENLNDNVDQQFLHNLVRKCGSYEELSIQYHPLTRKHLGLARIVFEEVKSAKDCVRVLHGKSVMGQQLQCYLDPRGASCRKMFLELTSEQPKPEPPPSQPEPDVPQAPEIPVDPVLPLAAMDSRSSSVDESPRHRSEEYHSNRRHEHSSRRRDRNNERWSDPRDREHRHRDRDDRNSTSNSHHTSYDESALSSLNLTNKFDPSYSHPEYWQQAAQLYAMQQAGAAGLPAEEQRESPKPNGEENDVAKAKDSPVIDLDTRLKMLMKDKSGAMPAFLLDELNSGSDSNDELKQVEVEVGEDDPDAPLSRPPSPFLSAEHYHINLRNRQKQTNQSSKRTSSRNSDRMSLSSLSSGDNNILQQSQPFPPQDTFGYPFYAPPPLPGQLPPPPAGFPTANGWATHYPPQYGNFPTPQGFQGYGTHPGGYNEWMSNTFWPPPEEYSGQYEEPSHPKSKKHLYRQVVKETLNSFVKELKRTLIKDIQKKMCEGYAFYLFDEWWKDQEEHHREKQSKQTTSKKPTSSVPPVGLPPPSVLLSNKDADTNISGEIKSLPRIPKAEDISSFFDKQRVNIEANRGLTTLSAGGSLGFGFRGTIPKLPSFKRRGLESNSTSHRSSTSRRDVASSDEDSKHRKKKSERRKEHQHRREERLRSKDEHRKEEEEKTKVKTREDKKQRDEELESRLSSKVSSPVREGSRKASSLSASSDSDTSHEKRLTIEKSRRKKKTSKAWSAKSSSSDESTTSQRSSVASSAEESSSDERKKTSSVESDEKSTQSSTSSTSASSSSETEDDAEKDRSSSAESETESVKESRAKRRPVPVRRPSVAVVKVDDVPNGEIRDVVEPVVDIESRNESPAFIADHCYAKPQIEEKTDFANQFANDHGYTKPRSPTPERPAIQPQQPKAAMPKREMISVAKAKRVKPVAAVAEKLKQLKFTERSDQEELNIMIRFLMKGLDVEDLRYFQRAYELLLKKDDKNSELMNYTHWVDHPATDVPPPKRRKSENDFSRPHITGSCRTEGYYKMDPREKRRTKYHLQRPEAYEAITQQYRYANTEGAVTKNKGLTSQSQSREARSTQRRQLAVLGEEVALNSDLLKFNQLKFRRKQLSFGKSAIHDWGLFAREDIGADEMVIEYVGHVIRPLIADIREKRYEKQGIGSSYLFRIDQDYVVDATKCGNLARFINHSCDPNCYAKIITIDGEKKIVIYSKQHIAFGEEITYDYKFPIEDEKILCLCGSKNCRKYLN